jgi:two-component system sensor histidine kinase QseC
LLAGFGLLLAVGGAILYFAVHTVFLREFDTALLAKAQALATLTKRDGEKIELEFAEELMPEFQDAKEGAYFQVWRPDGQLLERSPSLHGVDLPRRSGDVGFPLFWDLPLPDGRRGRAVAFAFAPHIEDEKPATIRASKRSPPATVMVAMERSAMDHQLRIFAGATVGASILMMVGGAVLALIVIRRALGPLAELAEGVGEIDSSTLGSRFPLDRLPIELKPICQRLNELLSRLQSAFERERHFSADVAHELRTPVAELRALAEVALKWPAGDAETQQAFADALAIAEQMDGIVSGLLVVARCESGVEQIRREPIALEPFIRDAWRSCAGQAARKELAVRVDLSPDATVESDRAVLRIILANVLSNAAEYAPAGGEISISATRSAKTIILSIANSVTDLQAADLPHLFDRFWRKASARTSSNRAGLGLSISRAGAHLLGTELRAEIPRSGMFVITLTLPVSADAAGDGEALASPPGNCATLG